MNFELNEQVFGLLEKKSLGITTKIIRPGMSLWEILAFDSILLARDANCEQLVFDANFNSLTRKMVSISDFVDNKKIYLLQTLKDNIVLLD